jgi:ferredoxin
MPRVRILPARIELDVPAGERLLDACDDDAPGALALSCRAANCGSCRLRVRAGADALQPPDATERSILTQLGAAPDERLGCQIRLMPAEALEVSEHTTVVLELPG